MKLIYAALFISACCLLGCTPSTSGVRLHGSVVLDAKPIENGMITFCETDRDQSYAAPIKSGKYELRLAPGEKTVRITGLQQTGTVPRNNFPGDTAQDPVFESIVPECYNSKTTLSCTVPDRGGEQHFELSSKP